MVRSEHRSAIKYTFLLKPHPTKRIPHNEKGNTIKAMVPNVRIWQP
jgi:hypothetical protein